VRELYDLIYSLTSYKGFPQSMKLRCPIFTQDKFDYVRACSHITIPTFRFDMQLSLDTLKSVDALRDIRGSDARDVESSMFDFLMVSCLLDHMMRYAWSSIMSEIMM
jgi:hypothetical protein